MDALLHDLRDTWRGLRRDRLYAIAVIATLALTLGASTAVFSIVDGVLLRPLAYPEPEALVSIREILPDNLRYPTLPVQPRHFDVWRDRATSFTSMAEMDWRTSTLTGAGDAAQVRVLRTSGTLFDVLRIPLALGRGLAREDEREDRPQVTVIGDRLWRDRLGGDPAVLGRTLTLGGSDYTIVGVLPAGYALPELRSLAESGTVTRDVAAIIPFRTRLTNFDWMGEFNYSAIARLKPGITLAQARAEMDVVQAGVAEIVRRETHEPAELRGWVMPLEQTIVGPVRRGLLLLLGAIGTVLLIACANLANLTLTRTTARLRDAALKGALGASRWRLARGILVDQVVLGVVGGGLGLLVAVAALRVFVTTAPVGLPRVQDVAIDVRVVAFAGLLTLLAALAVALLPAVKISRGRLESILRSGGRTSDRGGQRVRAALLVAQVGLCVMLLAVTGLFVSSLNNVLAVDTGFAPDGAVTIEVAPVTSRYPDVPQRAALYDRILDGVHAVPGVTAAAWTSALPLMGETWVDQIVRTDRPGAPPIKATANYRFIGPEYFRAIGMPIVEGRSIEPQDRGHKVIPVVLSARAAQTLWPNDRAVGRQFTRGDLTERFEVVGLVPDGHVTALESASPLMVYLPYWYNNEGKSVLVVRARGDVVPSVRRIVHDVDPDVAIAKVAPLQGLVDAAVDPRRYQASLFTAFAAIALVIAVVGVYATTAYGISRRRREMNIRVALGARVSQVFALVLGQSMLPLGIGLACGVVGALAVGGLVAGLLFDVTPRDPTVLSVVAAAAAVTGLASALIAVRRGLRINPAAALRDE